MIKIFRVPAVILKFLIPVIALTGLINQAQAVNCNGLAEWNSQAVYTGGNQVKQSGKAYQANYWTQNNSPASNSGPWQHWSLLGNCDGGTASSVKSSVSSSKSSSKSSVASSKSSSKSSVASSKSSSKSSVASSKSSSKSSAASSSAGNDCGSAWYKANLTNYESYPDPGSEECIEFNGCTWAGQFYGLNEKMPESWVMVNNIAAIHLKDWNWLGMKTLNLRQGTKRITVKVYDGCSDSDCNGCCTQNLGGDGYLIDLEKYTKNRFGSGSGIVEFQVCN